MGEGVTLSPPMVPIARMLSGHVIVMGGLDVFTAQHIHRLLVLHADSVSMDA